MHFAADLLGGLRPGNHLTVCSCTNTSERHGQSQCEASSWLLRHWVSEIQRAAYENSDNQVRACLIYWHLQLATAKYLKLFKKNIEIKLIWLTENFSGH